MPLMCAVRRARAYEKLRRVRLRLRNSRDESGCSSENSAGLPIAHADTHEEESRQ